MFGRKEVSKINASDLVELMKKGSLSVEQLKELVTFTNGFFKELCEALKENVRGRTQSHDAAIKALLRAIEALEKIADVENCSEKLRFAMLEKVSKISDQVYSLQDKHEENSHNESKWMIGLLAGATALLMLLAGNHNNSLKVNNGRITS